MCRDHRPVRSVAVRLLPQGAPWPAALPLNSCKMAVRQRCRPGENGPAQGTGPMRASDRAQAIVPSRAIARPRAIDHALRIVRTVDKTLQTIALTAPRIVTSGRVTDRSVAIKFATKWR